MCRRHFAHAGGNDFKFIARLSQKSPSPRRIRRENKWQRHCRRPNYGVADGIGTPPAMAGRFRGGASGGFFRRKPGGVFITLQPAGPEKSGLGKGRGWTTPLASVT